MMKLAVILLPLCSQLFTCVHLVSVNTSANPTPQGNPVVAALRISDYWTEWYDVDHPDSGLGDYETLDSITSKVGTYICPTTHSITDAECRIDDEDGGDDRKDILYRSCSTNGLICRNRDQPSGICNDYNIRFYCSLNNNDRDNSRSTPRFDMRIYIILAAVPVAIFVLRICWSCTFERRRRRLRRAARARRRAQQEEDIDPEVFMPPPSYQELFGDSEGPFALSRQYSLCRKCKSSQCIIFRNRQPRNSETQNSGNSHTELSDSSSEVINMAAADSPPDDSSRSSVESAELPQTEEQISSSELNDSSQTPNTSTGSSESSQTNNTSTGSSESSQTTNTSTGSGASHPQLNPQTVEASHCDCPCHKRAPEVMAYDNPAYEPEVQIQDGRSSRFPGMHLSVFSLFRSPSESSITEPPPPTYKEALKILKKNQKGKP